MSSGPKKGVGGRLTGGELRYWPLPRHAWLCGLAALLFYLGLAPSAQATDGLEPIGLSVQSLLRGGSDVAIGDSALSQIDNPASLRLNRGAVDVAGEFLMPVTRWRGVYDTSGSSVHCLPLGHIGLALPGNDRFNFGVAAWSKSQIATSFHLRPAATLGDPQRVNSDMRDFGFAFDGAVSVTDNLALGAGLRCELITGEFLSLAGPEQVYFGRGYGLGAGFQLGLHYRIVPGLTFGLGYRSPTWFQDLFGEHSSPAFSNDWQVITPGYPGVDFGRATINDFVLPQKISAGLAWQATNRLRLSAEGRWLNYENSSMYRADYNLASSRVNLNSTVGYRDQFAIMAGAEYKLTDHWTIGGGYHHASNPISRRAFLPIADMIVVHHLTAGLTYRQGHWWFGGGYILGLPNTLAAAPLTQILLGADSIRGELRQAQHSVFVGCGYRW